LEVLDGEKAHVPSSQQQFKSASLLEISPVLSPLALSRQGGGFARGITP